MKTYEFTIIASGLDPEAEDFEARFFDAGCDDATVSYQKGHILIDISREAETLEQAISTAVANVRQAGAHVDRLEPDPLVSLADIAARAEMSRAAMTNYSKGHRQADFPAPVARVTTNSPFWDWAQVSRWLFEKEKVPFEVMHSAVVVSAANELLEQANDNLENSLSETVASRLPAFA